MNNPETRPTGRRAAQTWRTGEVAALLGMPPSQVSVHAIRWNFEHIGVGHGSGSRAEWTDRDIATFRALLRLREQIGGQLPTVIVDAVIERMAHVRKGSQNIDVRIGSVMIRVPVDWTTPDTVADSGRNAAVA